MWLGSLRILFVTFCVLLLTQEAQAQQATGQGTTQGTPQGSSHGADNGIQTLVPRVAPAPVIAPAMSPQDQANLAARQQQRQQAAFNETTAPGAAPVSNPNITSISANTGTNAAIAASAPPSAPPLGITASTPDAAGANTPPSAALSPDVPASASPAVSVAPADNNMAVTPSNSAGFSPNNARTRGDTLPLSSGTMPITGNMSVTNNNVDMNITPGMVGYDPNQPPSAANPVPYEVQLEQRTTEIQQKARDLAYEQAKKSVLPLESYEIRDVLGRLKNTQEAIQTPVRGAPNPANVIRTISTDPSATPQTISLAAGNVTTINIIDVTGEPWPIVDIGFGGPFDVKPPEAGGHVIRITPLKDFARGNMVVRLLKMVTPITFTLQAGTETVNYRFDARIPERGPNAKQPIINVGLTASAGDKVTTSFLEGVPPTGAEKLVVDGIDGRTSAYKFGGALYVRTPLSLLSPAWTGSATSADGMKVYVLNE
ncbi:MAG: IcmK (DotH) protein [Alphaproteobacteria bacterium]|nr:IcmK (DotH) protein [Alphaproteobacteria bacterium]